MVSSTRTGPFRGDRCKVGGSLGIPPLHAVGMGLLPACSAPEVQILSPSTYPLVFITAAGAFGSRMPRRDAEKLKLYLLLS